MWIDDCRPAPPGYYWITSVNEAKRKIKHWEALYRYNPMYNDDCLIEIIDIDDNAGYHASDGGDYIKLLEWLEETDRNYLIRIHGQNPVEVENMRRIIEKNGWEEIK